MKRLGRKNRPFYRICATDGRAPRDGKVIEELGHYDPMVKETDARAVLNRDRIDYWLSVGAQPSDKVSVLIKKYGTQGTHLAEQEMALSRLKQRPAPPEPVPVPLATRDARKTADTIEAENTAETADAEDSGETAGNESEN
jgi:small subunit ribosomal protein S16